MAGFSLIALSPKFCMVSLMLVASPDGSLMDEWVLSFWMTKLAFYINGILGCTHTGVPLRAGRPLILSNGNNVIYGG